MAIDFATISITWLTSPPDEKLAEIESMIRAEMKKELTGLAKPVDLIFHSIFLSDNYEGPSVVVSGRDEGFVASYEEETKFVSLASFDDDQ